MSVIATWATATGNGPVRDGDAERVAARAPGVHRDDRDDDARDVRARAGTRRGCSLREHAALAEAEAALRASDVFLAMLSHELRNPLSAIAAARPCSSSRASRRTPQAARAIIKRQTAHFTRLIDDLLDVARVTVGQDDAAAQAVTWRTRVQRRDPIGVATVIAPAARAAQARDGLGRRRSGSAESDHHQSAAQRAQVHRAPTALSGSRHVRGRRRRGAADRRFGQRHRGRARCRASSTCSRRASKVPTVRMAGSAWGSRSCAGSRRCTRAVAAYSDGRRTWQHVRRAAAARGRPAAPTRSAARSGAHNAGLRDPDRRGQRGRARVAADLLEMRGARGPRGGRRRDRARVRAEREPSVVLIDIGLPGSTATRSRAASARSSPLSG